MNTIGAILAGGQSKRFGSNKALFDTGGGLTMLDQAIAHFKPQVDHLIICGGDNASSYQGLNLPVLDDGDYKNRGPLGGIVRALSRIAVQNPNAVLITLPCDSPYPPDDYAVRLVASLKTAHAVYAKTEHDGHYTHAAWRTSALEPLRNLIQNKAASMRAAHSVLQSNHCLFEDSADRFRNHNTPPGSS